MNACSNDLSERIAITSPPVPGTDFLTSATTRATSIPAAFVDVSGCWPSCLASRYSCCESIFIPSSSLANVCDRILRGGMDNGN